MRQISANYIIPVNQAPIKNGLITIDDNGQIININQLTEEQRNTEFYNGVIVPGFVNAHCHLELSYLKGKIPKHTGHEKFIKKVVNLIQSTLPNEDDILSADNQMINEGIVAVGDISNTTISAEIKRNSQIYYHTFIEIADFFDPQIATEKIQYAKNISEIFENYSIVAHSPYTCSPKFVEKTANLSEKIYSIHNQETSTENNLYLSGQGSIADLIRQSGKFNKFEPTKLTSLQSYFSKLPKDKNLLLVHNLFTNIDDIKFAENYTKNAFWVMCPNSNLYIQNQKPQLENFRKNNCKICLGTDSLATNDKLSILAEIQTLCSDFEFLEVLQWATLNGAKALKIDNIFGSIEIGKKPGLNLITNFDFQNFRPTQKSRIKKLL
jgi:cytosine/adenosine deaminase-related metal-dependent hydrolase